MHLLLLGMNHRTASLRERESLALDRDQTSRVLAAVLGRGAADEAFVLSTCNRTEFYVAATDPSIAVSGIDAALHDVKDAALSVAGGSTYQHSNGAAVRHLLRVATGLDSMVLGEPQILSQMKEAFGLARVQGATGTLLDRLIETALRTGKRARAETAIGTGVISVASAACELARRSMPSLDGRNVAVIGAGETGRLAAQHLARYCPGGVTIVNRSVTRAETVASAIGAAVRPLSDVGAAVAAADLVISATSAPGTILSADAVRAAMATRPGRPLVIIDLAVPRDVDPEAAAIPGVTLHSIDDIQTVVDGSLARRAAETPRVDAIIDEEATRFDLWVRALEATPLVRDLRDHFERVRLEELDRALANASDEERARADRLTRALVNRLLHLPTVRLKDTDPASHEGASRLRAARELFALDSRPS